MYIYTHICIYFHIYIYIRTWICISFIAGYLPLFQPLFSGHYSRDIPSSIHIKQVGPGRAKQMMVGYQQFRNRYRFHRYILADSYILSGR